MVNMAADSKNIQPLPMLPAMKYSANISTTAIQNRGSN
jgi:hypothetical protein